MLHQTLQFSVQKKPVEKELIFKATFSRSTEANVTSTAVQ